MALDLSAILNSRPRWRSGAGDPALRLNYDGLVLSATPAAEAAIGAKGGLEGRSFLDFIAREDRPAMKEALTAARARARDAAAPATPVTMLRPGRSAAFVEVSVARQGGGLVVLIRDRGPELSRIREGRAEAEVGAPPAEAGGSIAPETSAASDMIADLGHELKTPLNAIMGFAEAMQTETFGPLGDPKYREYAGLIHEAGAHLADLIAAILDRAKLDAGRYRLAPALAAPGPVAKAAAEMVRGEAEKAGLKFTVRIADNLSETMLDARAVKQVVINLLTNAVKFTAAGEIALDVAEKDGVIEFRVQDTGVGMSQMALARLGERFTDMHKNGVRGTSGAGLGLSLAFSLAKLHGGALTLSSAPGEGTLAVFSLPVRKSVRDLAEAGLQTNAADIQSQLDRVAQYRRERAELGKDGRSAA